MLIASKITEGITKLNGAYNLNNKLPSSGVISKIGIVLIASSSIYEFIGPFLPIPFANSVIFLMATCCLYNACPQSLRANIILLAASAIKLFYTPSHVLATALGTFSAMLIKENGNFTQTFAEINKFFNSFTSINR